MCSGRGLIYLEERYIFILLLIKESNYLFNYSFYYLERVEMYGDIKTLLYLLVNYYYMSDECELLHENLKSQLHENFKNE